MGVKQSKRSIDITETSTKGEIEGFGNEGKVEKIIDGVLEKVAVNGHVDGDLQNGIEPVQNGVEILQNGEAAAVATEKISETKSDESSVEGAVNGQVENGEVNGEAEKPEEGKKAEEKKEKKKEKKEKSVKKKFSLRNFSFSKKDKSKPLKEEKSSEKVNETKNEEAVTSPENEITPPVVTQTEITPMPVIAESISSETFTIQGNEGTPGKIEVNATKAAEDLPPPLPASPPPSEPVEGKISSGLSKLDISESVSPMSSGELQAVDSSYSNTLTGNLEMAQEVIKKTEQIAMETGKQIEEKATNLLKTVEERAEESMKAVGEALTQAANDLKEGCQNLLGGAESETSETKETSVQDEKPSEETVTGGPVDVTNVDSLTEKLEDSTDKHEEGAGESLADMPKDLTEEVTAATIEVPNPPDSLEIPPPPPVVEPVTGE